MRLWLLAGLLLASPLAYAKTFPGEQPTYARETGLNQRFFYVSTGDGEGQIEYICKSFPGTTGATDTSSSIWQVIRFTYDSSDRISTIAFAGGDDAYTQVCDNRTSLSY